MARNRDGAARVHGESNIGAQAATDAFGGQPLYLLRHCETEWSRKRLYQGQSDPPLSPEGVEHAARLSQILAPRLSKIAAIYSSPLTRSRMTAALIATQPRRSVQVEPLLSEVNYGEWEGLTQADIKARWPELYRQWKKAPASMTFPGGESLHGLKDRVRALLEKVRKVEGPVLAVTHIGVMRMVLLESTGLPLSEFRSGRFSHGGLLEVRRCDGGLKVVDPTPDSSEARSGATYPDRSPAEQCP